MSINSAVVPQSKVSDKVISELEQLVRTPPKHLGQSSFSTALKARFYASILLVITFGLLNLIFNSVLYIRDTAFFVGLIAWEWTNLHADALSQCRHTFFNVRNVLETYQPRAQTHGHLFQPEPDTPRPDCCSPTSGNEQYSSNTIRTIRQAIINEISNDQVSNFDQSVRQHYDGMYKEIKKSQVELKFLDRMKEDDKNLDAGCSDTGKLHEKLIPVSIHLFDTTKKSHKNDSPCNKQSDSNDF